MSEQDNGDTRRSRRTDLPEPLFVYVQSLGGQHVVTFAYNQLHDWHDEIRIGWAANKVVVPRQRATLSTDGLSAIVEGGVEVEVPVDRFDPKAARSIAASRYYDDYRAFGVFCNAGAAVRGAKVGQTGNLSESIAESVKPRDRVFAEHVIPRITGKHGQLEAMLPRAVKRTLQAGRFRCTCKPPAVPRPRARVKEVRNVA